MKNKIESPKINELTPLSALQVDSLMSKEEYSSCLISDCLIEYQEAERVSFDKVMFKNVTITESSLGGIELTDVIFENCDLSNVDFSEAFVHRTEFRHCKMIGTDFTRGRFKNVRILDCVGELASFRFGNLKQVAFEHSSLVSSDYYQASLDDVSFTECNIDQAMLEGCKLNGIDLSDSEFGSLKVDIQDLPGCIISAAQAATFVGMLGLVIK